MSGLRERKKRATVNAIERTAVRLALEKGHATVQVHEICEGADISRSTFFNYMPNREAAIFGRPLTMVPFEQAWGLMQQYADRSLLRGLYEVALVSVGGAEINPEVAAGRNRLVAEQPDCAAQTLAPFMTLSADLTGLLYVWFEDDHSRRRMPEVPVAREAMLTVSLVGSALQVAMGEVSGEEDTELRVHDVARIVAELRDIASTLGTPGESVDDSRGS